MHIQAWRAGILRFDNELEAESLLLETDGLLVTELSADGVWRVKAVGNWDALRTWLEREHPAVQVVHLPGRLLAPGFIDLHVHYPQVDVIASPAEGLLPWLENHTFPAEARFADPAHCRQTADFFCTELLRNGVTTALAFASSHPSSVEALFEASQQQGLRMVTGLCLMDRHAPKSLLQDAEQSLQATEALIRRWHGKGRLGYAITPRFAPSCTEAQLRGAGELSSRHADVWVQTHVAENRDEIAWVKDLFPQSRSYLSVYDDLGLMRPRAVFAHCIHFNPEDWALMRDRRAAAAVCPTSNLFLGSGFFDFAQAKSADVLHGLASDVGGGTSLSPFHTMLAAYQVGREGHSKQGLSISPKTLWWMHTAGAAQAMGLRGTVGNLQPGAEADVLVLNPQATELLARRSQHARNLDELLFVMAVLGDDRLIEKTVVAGNSL
jgi:guanine deaminase